MCYWLITAQLAWVGAWGALTAISFLSTVLCKMNWFPTEEACEKFPLIRPFGWVP
jgi:hypothetical protein